MNNNYFHNHHLHHNHTELIQQLYFIKSEKDPKYFLAKFKKNPNKTQNF